MGVLASDSMELNSVIGDETIEKKTAGFVETEHIISAINQSEEGVSIQGDKISLEGNVTANNYFKINRDGSMEALEGEIGKWMIEDFGLYKIMAQKIQNNITYRVLSMRSNDLEANWEFNPAIYMYQHKDTGELPVVRKDGNGWDVTVSGDNRLLDVNAPTLEPVAAEYPRLINNSDAAKIIAEYTKSHSYQVPVDDSGIFRAYVDTGIYREPEYITVSGVTYIKPWTGGNFQYNLSKQETSEIVWYDGGEVELEEGRTYKLSIYVKHEREFETNAIVYLAHGYGLDKHVIAYSATNPEYKQAYYIDRHGDGKKIYRKYTSKLEYDLDVEGYYTNHKGYGWIDETGVMREYDDTEDWAEYPEQNEWSKKTLTFTFNNNEYGQINNKTKIYFGIAFLGDSSISDSNRLVDSNIYDDIVLNGFSLVDANPTTPDNNWHEMVPAEGHTAEEVMALIRYYAQYTTRLTITGLDLEYKNPNTGDTETTTINPFSLMTGDINASGNIESTGKMTAHNYVESTNNTKRTAIGFDRLESTDGSRSMTTFPSQWGRLYTVSPANKEINSGADTTIASLQLPAGVYYIMGKANFAGGSSAGVREVHFSFDNNGTAIDRWATSGQKPVGGTNITGHVVCYSLVLTATRTVYLCGYQTSGEKLNLTSIGIRAIRIV